MNPMRSFVALMSAQAELAFKRSRIVGGTLSNDNREDLSVEQGTALGGIVVILVRHLPDLNLHDVGVISKGIRGSEHVKSKVLRVHGNPKLGSILEFSTDIFRQSHALFSQRHQNHFDQQ